MIAASRALSVTMVVNDEQTFDKITNSADPERERPVKDMALKRK